MAAPVSVIALIERFKQNLADYRSGKYNETQLRREFLDPFFKTLGWDVDNEKGYAEAYKDVIHEDVIKVGGLTKAPDYCFRIGGAKKFFLEAKKPSINLRDETSPAFQLRRYAWSAKLPLSILSDFEEFAVYDCRIRPLKTDTAATARILYCRFTDYHSKWDEITSVFSHEAVLKGSFDRYAESTLGKRGTTEVDSSFLKEIEGWRETLAKNIALRNPSLTTRELNFVVQRIIDRIIFLRICEDRGMESYGRLQALLNGSSVYSRLLQLFYHADTKYNSGLFYFTKEKGRPELADMLTPQITIDDRPLKAILQNLYYPESPYEFSVLPVDILGQVYEQFLGKVIRLTPSHQAKVEDKPEVKKAGGVYYTPTYIVDYIVKYTVGQLLDGKTPKEIAHLKVLDPACGSGSFLIGAYQHLLDWHRDWYENHYPEKHTKEVYQGAGGSWRLTTAEKKRILLNNIYGVDIDPQAVEVTKLSLSLKVLEGENEETLQQMRLFKERALPDLGRNIKCGNSLVSPDFYQDEQLTLLDEEERYRINAFDWQAEFPDVFQRENPGFDSVIGNPPYVRQEMLGRLKDYFQRHYKVYQGTADLYAYFIERGVSLLRAEGIFGIIVANKWMRANYGLSLRRWLKTQRILEITDFNDLPVFRRATTYPCILRVQKGRASPALQADQVETLDFPSLDEYVAKSSFPVSIAALRDGGWFLADDRVQGLIEKVRSAGIPLGEYVRGKIYRGVLTGLNETFVIDAGTRERLIQEDPKSAELIKPFLMGRDIKRYQPPQSDRHLIFTRRGVGIKDYPAVERYLSQFKPQLMPKPPDWKGGDWKGRKPGSYQWYEIQDAVDYYREFEKPKIICPAIVQKASHAFDWNGFYSNQKTTIILTTELHLLGLLNSTLLDFFIHSLASTKAGGYFEYQPMYLQQLPILRIDFQDPSAKDHHDRMVSLVQHMLDLHKQLTAAKTDFERTALERQITATDQQIDQIVYDLYDLTEEEIHLVEQYTKK